MGIATKRPLILKKGAVATIFPKPLGGMQPSTSGAAEKTTPRSAFAKRERKRVSFSVIVMSQQKQAIL